ncbi:MAG: hypothetical protein HYT80_08310 [Euryarchaeota archaeon]|nr:hypothetical protein [Euryarchaeota archaeon]
MLEKRVGVVSSYDAEIREALVRIERGALHEGDRVLIAGHGHELVEPVRSLEENQAEVLDAHRGETVGFLVDYPVEKDDDVYLLDSAMAPRRKGALPAKSPWAFP